MSNLNKTQNLMCSNIQNAPKAIQNCSAYKSKISQHAILSTKHAKKWDNFLNSPEKRH